MGLRITAAARGRALAGRGERVPPGPGWSSLRGVRAAPIAIPAVLIALLAPAPAAAAENPAGQPPFGAEPVPEPTTYALFLSGALVLAWTARRRRSTSPFR